MEVYNEPWGHYMVYTCQYRLCILADSYFGRTLFADVGGVRSNGNESSRMAPEQIASAVIAVMPGAVCATLSRARQREEWSGSWPALMSVCSIRCFFAWAAEVIDEAIEG